MIYVDFRRALIATDNTIYSQVEKLDEFKDYFRENWLQPDKWSDDFKECLQETMDDLGCKEAEDVTLSDFPEWAYNEIQALCAKDWIFKNYTIYQNPDEQGNIKKIRFL